MGKRLRWCPVCGFGTVLPVVYGYPTPDGWAEAEEGRAVLGGCVIDPDGDAFRCDECGMGFDADGEPNVDRYRKGRRRDRPRRLEVSAEGITLSGEGRSVLVGADDVPQAAAAALRLAVADMPVEEWLDRSGLEPDLVRHRDGMVVLEVSGAEHAAFVHLAVRDGWRAAGDLDTLLDAFADADVPFVAVEVAR